MALQAPHPELTLPAFRDAWQSPSVRVTNNRTEEEYLHQLDSSLISIVQESELGFKAISQKCQGAWPALISERLRSLQLWGALQTEAPTQYLADSIYAPELHPNFFEWYFSDATAAALSQKFLSRHGFNLLLGTPTIALKAAQMGAPYLLVDRNPLVERRFPLLANNILHGQVEALSSTIEDCKVIFLDAPWYLETIVSWLSLAARIVSRGTKIVMPLFPELTRPAASDERRAVVRFAEMIGTVSIISDLVEYDSPLFEWEALTSKGIYPHANWRRADLLTVDAFGPQSIRPPNFDEGRPQENWETFVIGTQVVQLRLRRRGSSHFFMKPLGDNSSFVLDSVSIRDPRRPLVDILSSRNRAAVVGNTQLVRYVLTILSRSFEQRTRHLPESVSTLLGQTDSEMLARFLCWDRTH
jgi:hypothetical protein